MTVNGETQQETWHHNKESFVNLGRMNALGIGIIRICKTYDLQGGQDKGQFLKNNPRNLKSYK